MVFCKTTGAGGDTWLGRLARRRPNNVAAVALANKMARQIWALMAYRRTYEPNYAQAATATVAKEST